MEFRPNVLLVEGNVADEVKARQVIKDSEINCDLRVAHDGEEACQMLFDGDEHLPTLIILALNLPKLDGYEVLSRIRNHNETKRLPVIVYAHSGDQLDVARCFDLHANSYVQKDKDMDRYETRLKLLLYYWIAVNQNVNT